MLYGRAGPYVICLYIAPRRESGVHLSFLFIVTGYIDLSKRRVSAEDVEKCTEKFSKAKAVNSILRHVAELLNYESGESHLMVEKIITLYLY